MKKRTLILTSLAAALLAMGAVSRSPAQSGGVSRPGQFADAQQTDVERSTDPADIGARLDAKERELDRALADPNSTLGKIDALRAERRDLRRQWDDAAAGSRYAGGPGYGPHRGYGYGDGGCSGPWSGRTYGDGRHGCGW